MEARIAERQADPQSIFIDSPFKPVDRDGNKMQNPVDDNNHAIDAIRYLAMNKLSSLSDWMDFE